MATTQTDMIKELQRTQVRPSAIRKGDLMRDLGSLREVDHVEALDDEITSSTMHTVFFTPDACAFGSLGIREASEVTVWRLPEC